MALGRALPAPSSMVAVVDLDWVMALGWALVAELVEVKEPSQMVLRELVSLHCLCSSSKVVEH